MDKISFFSADYRDGRVHIGGKSYPAGTFAVHLLNQFYENDTAARIGVFTTDNWQLENMLRILWVMVSPKLSVSCDIKVMMSPSLRVEGSTSFTRIKEPVLKSVAAIESELTMYILNPKRSRSFLLNVVTEMTVKIIIDTAINTINQTIVVLIMLNTFFTALNTPFL